MVKKAYWKTEMVREPKGKKNQTDGKGGSPNSTTTREEA